MELDSKNISIIAVELSKLPPVSPKQSKSYDKAAIKILDCVLSLNRDFDKFVVPRIDHFEANNPHIISLAELNGYIDHCPDQYHLFIVDLNYKDYDRADLLNRTLKWLIKEVRKYPGNDETERLKGWATRSKPEDYQNTIIYKGIKLKIPVVEGLGIAGWQYLRMLFGADTCKPDRHIKGFIKECTGNNIGDIKAVNALHAAAPIAGFTVREADRRIWRYMANKAKSGGQSKRTGRAKYCL